MKNSSAVRALFLAVAMLVGIALTPGTAMADKLHLKDGRVLEGTVIREVEGYVWFEYKIGSIESRTMFKPEEIKQLEREDSTPAPSEAPAAAPKKEENSAPSRFGVPRAAIISLGEGGDKDMVGVYMTADSLRRIIPLLEAEKVDTVVFRISSGGGMVLEVQRLSDVIHNEYKPKFRVVAWIESAISAAAMTAHCIEDIYFMRIGNYGACTAFSGGLVAAEGRPLEEYLFMMEKISARGGYDKQIMRSMQIPEPLSCTIDANGDVHWYKNEDGEYLVNPEGSILTFDAKQAMKYKFGKGIADTYEELGKAMGFAEVEWVGKRVPGIPYPVCRAEEDMRKFRNQTYDDERRLREYFFTYNSSLAVAAGRPREERGPFIGKCRQALDMIRRMVRNNPNFTIRVFGMLPEQFPEWIEEREKEIRDLNR